jgi:CubicO group peptidase (beta-lactamase class C family)
VATENKNIPVVSGGAHWGGGVFANAYDHAHIGALYLRRGRWGDQQLLSEAWVEATLQPCALNPDYGLLWWLNRRRKVFPTAPTTGFCARGNLGRQLLWVDPAHNLIIVSRWSDEVGLLLAEVTTALARNMPSC